MTTNNKNIDKQGKKLLNVPNLRFPEFEGEWEDTTIANVATVVGGGTPETSIKEYWDGDIIWFTPSEIGKKKYVAYSERTISCEGMNNSSAKLLPIGTILLSTRATIGEASIATQSCCTNQGFQSLIANENINNEFLYYLIATKRKDLLRKSCGSTFLEISAKEIRKIKIRYASYEEQSKIARFLALIDERIATQSRIIEDLRSLKIYIHNRVFSKGNTLLGQRNSIRLSDVATKITRKNKGNTIINVLSNSATMGIVPQAKVFDKEIANEDNTANYYVIEKGNFVYNPRKSAQAPFGPINMYKGQVEGIISPLYLCFQVTDINKNYLLHYFMSSAWYSYIYSNGDTGVRHDRVSIKDETFLDMPLYIHTVDKQQEIARMMDQIDAKIDLEELYLTKLQKQKDYLLEAMFV